MPIDPIDEDIERLEAKANFIRMEIKKKTGRVDDLKSRPGEEVSELNNVEMHLGFKRMDKRFNTQDEEIQKVRDVAYMSKNIIDAVWWIVSSLLLPICTAILGYIGYLLYTYIEFKVKINP